MRRFGVLLFLLGLAVPGFGQSNYAVLTGIVTDSQHLPVVGAAVKLTAASTGAIRRVVTNQHGLEHRRDPQILFTGVRGSAPP